jgi:hypothetical protein
MMLKLGDTVKQEDLYLALNETIHALRFTQAAGSRFVVGAEEVESGSSTAASVAYIGNQLADAQSCLSNAEGEIGRLLQENSKE